jgi:hypothetical protein
VLERCNQADYVPRDLLQAGTAWLTFDIGALWDGNPLGADAAKEWSLIDAAVSYLNDRFFHSPEALLAHSLVARVVAGGLLAESLDKKALGDLFLARDEHWLTRLKRYHRNRLAELHKQIPRIAARWALVGQFTDVSLPAGSRLEMEDKLSGTSGKARLSYPFTSGVSIYVEKESRLMPRELLRPGQELATVTVHQREDPRPFAARPMLDVVGRLSERIPPYDQLGDNLASWLLRDRVEQRWPSGERMCGEIARENEEGFKAAIRGISALSSLQQLLETQFIGTPLGALASPGFPLEQQPQIVAPLLQFPWRILRVATARKALDVIRAGALGRTSVGSRSARGYALELAVVADQLIASGNPKHRFVIVGATLLGKDGQPVTEWDVLRIDLDESHAWSLTAVECAVSRNAAKDGEAREKLEHLQHQVADRFTDLTSYRTLLATVKEGQLKYADAGRSWSPVDP